VPSCSKPDLLIFFVLRSSYLWPAYRVLDREQAHDLQMAYWAWKKDVNQFYYDYNKVMAEEGPGASE
jgi:hypothetical protein